MSRKGDDAIRSFLRSSETSRITLDVELAEGTNFGVAPAQSPNVKPNDTRWLLSIVTHALGELEQARWVTGYSFGDPGIGAVKWAGASERSITFFVLKIYPETRLMGVDEASSSSN